MQGQLRISGGPEAGPGPRQLARLPGLLGSCRYVRPGGDGRPRSESPRRRREAAARPARACWAAARATAGQAFLERRFLSRPWNVTSRTWTPSPRLNSTRGPGAADSWKIRGAAKGSAPRAGAPPDPPDGRRMFPGRTFRIGRPVGVGSSNGSGSSTGDVPSGTSGITTGRASAGIASRTTGGFGPWNDFGCKTFGPQDDFGLQNDFGALQPAVRQRLA